MKTEVETTKVTVPKRKVNNPAPSYYRNHPYLLRMVNIFRILTFRKRYNTPLNWWTISHTQDEMRTIHGLDVEKEIIEAMSEEIGREIEEWKSINQTNQVQ
jgi:hypothetical protein